MIFLLVLSMFCDSIWHVRALIIDKLSDGFDFRSLQTQIAQSNFEVLHTNIKLCNCLTYPYQLCPPQHVIHIYTYVRDSFSSS